jgi:hypothetical protein
MKNNSAIFSVVFFAHNFIIVIRVTLQKQYRDNGRKSSGKVHLLLEECVSVQPVVPCDVHCG